MEGSRNENQLGHGDESSQLDVILTRDADVHDMDIHECYKVIDQLLRLMSSRKKPSEFYIPALLEHFQKFPSLATQKFSGLDSVKRFPLFYFVRGKADLETVQLIYQMCPRALKMDPGNRNDSIIYQACILDDEDYENVIEFLLSQHSESLGRIHKEERNSPGYLPIHLIMGRRILRGGKGHASLQHIKKLVALYPQCIRRYDSKQRTPLHYAIYEGFDPSVVNFLLDQMSQRLPILTLSGQGCHDNYIFDMPAAKNLVLVLQQVQIFKCKSVPFTDDSILRVLQGLQESCPYLVSLFLNVPNETLYRNTSIRSAIKEIVIKNTAIKSLSLSAMNTSQPTITGREEGDYEDTPIVFECDELVRGLSEGLRFNHSIELLQLKSMTVRNCDVMFDLLQSGASPETLRLQEVRFLGQCFNPPDNVLATSSLRKIEIVWCVFTFECMTNFLYGLGRIACLESLILMKLSMLEEESDYLADNSQQQRPRFDITGPVIELLKRGQLEHLQLLSISPQVNVRAICEVLQSNTSLKTYFLEDDCKEEEENDLLRDVLAHHNTTLEEVNSGQDPEIMYYTDLNKFGRKMARDESCTPEEFVGLLCNVVNDNFLPMQHILLHGVLVEAPPSLWFRAVRYSQQRVSAQVRKRKIYERRSTSRTATNEFTHTAQPEA